MIKVYFVIFSIKGSKTNPMLPKPGEFLFVASGKPIDQLGYLDIPLSELLDVIYKLNNNRVRKHFLN